MSKEAKLVVEPRSEVGSAACRRLRLNGKVPGVVYGHGTDATAVMVCEEALRPVVTSGTHVVDLTMGGEAQKAVIREVQWNVFGTEIHHVDLMRVDPNERVTITVPFELKGTAPGVIGGGILDQPMHTITIDCLAYQIPDTIQIRIGSLQLGDVIHVRDLELPEGTHPHAQPDAIVLHIVKARQELEVTPTAATATQPEVVGKKVAEGAEAAKDDKKDDKKKK